MYRLFKIIFLFITLFIFFPFQFVCSAQSLEQLKPEIRNNRKTHINGITSPINRIKYCDEKLNALSLAVTDVTEYISENNSLCEFIYIEMQLEQCLQSNSELLADVKSIISTISGIKNHCSSLVGRQFLREKEIHLDITAKLRENLSHLLNDENDLIKHDKPLKCNPFSSGIFSEIEASFLQTKEAYNSGNLYITNKNLERVDVLSELMSILFEICGNIESMMRVEYKRDAVFEMKGELIGSVRVLAQNLFDDLTFEQSSEIICRHLKEKDADRFGLCENPINNPSWIYSVNHFLRQVE